MALVVPAMVANVVGSLLVSLVAFCVLYPASYSPLAALFRCPQTTFARKHVVITGGATGLGKALATEMALRGSRVTIISRSRPKLEAAVSDISAACSRPGDVMFVPADVTDAEAVAKAVAQAVDAFGPVDLLVCNAGMAKPGYVMDTPAEVFAEQMTLNYCGCVNTVRAGLPHMPAGSRILVVSSALGITGSIGYSQYAATKYALRGFAESLRLELAPKGVAVTLFLPPNMNTPGYEIEELTKPAEARAIDQTSPTLDPAEAARRCIEGLEEGVFALTTTWDIDILRIGGNGAPPSPRPVVEFLLLPVCWISLAFVRMDWEGIIAKFARQKLLMASQAKTKTVVVVYKGEAVECQLTPRRIGGTLKQEAARNLAGINKPLPGEFELALLHEFGSSKELRGYGTPKMLGGEERLILRPTVKLLCTFFKVHEFSIVARAAAAAMPVGSSEFNWIPFVNKVFCSVFFQLDQLSGKGQLGLIIDWNTCDYSITSANCKPDW
eukprot:m51a1_g10795 putative 3-dehydrosphinganine reductase (497) ;mRNA; r:55202-58292